MYDTVLTLRWNLLAVFYAAMPRLCGRASARCRGWTWDSTCRLHFCLLQYPPQSSCSKLNSFLSPFFFFLPPAASFLDVVSGSILLPTNLRFAED
jgi:hypothetical protein